MKERPILFSAPMVRAILDGSKTQTRRVIKPEPTAQPKLCPNITNKGCPSWVSDLYIQGARMGSQIQTCPYGQPGDRLYVKETFHKMYNADNDTYYYVYRADREAIHGKWTPSIYMSRWASRITLEITGVRVERLQEISEVDAKAEGAPLAVNDVGEGYRAGFAFIWRAINGAESWAANPWVWVIEFKRVA